MLTSGEDEEVVGLGHGQAARGKFVTPLTEPCNGRPTPARAYFEKLDPHFAYAIVGSGVRRYRI